MSEFRQNIKRAVKRQEKSVSRDKANIWIRFRYYINLKLSDKVIKITMMTQIINFRNESVTSMWTLRGQDYHELYPHKFDNLDKMK